MILRLPVFLSLSLLALLAAGCATAIKPSASAGAGTAGFYRVHSEGARSWLVTPGGDDFLMLATDHATYNGAGRSRYDRFLIAKYGNEEAWATETARRLHDWNCNALSWGDSPSLRRWGFPFTETLRPGSEFAAKDALSPRENRAGFPNVFSPGWADYCEKMAAEHCEALRDNPNLIGYFIDNELDWKGRSGASSGLFEEAWKLPADRTTKAHWIAFLAEKGRTIADFNAAWGTRFADFDALCADVLPPKEPPTEAARDLAREWVRRVADLYFSTATQAIRRHDPNHLILGCRFAGGAPEIWEVVGRYCDVVSVNLYPRIDLERGIFESQIATLREFHEKTGRPLLISEWSFPALDAGLPCSHGGGTRVSTQEQRAHCFRLMQETLLRLPFIVGSNYFMYVDEPAEGVSPTFPEDSNYGLINERDEPYAEITDAMRDVHSRALALHRAGGAVGAQPRRLTPQLLDASLTSRQTPPSGGVALEAGGLKIEGPVPGLGMALHFDGEMLGYLCPLILRQAGGARGGLTWEAAACVAQGENADYRMTEVEYRGTWKTGSDPDNAHPAGGDAAAQGSTAAQISTVVRTRWRYWVPRDPSAAWVGSACLWVENTGADPLPLGEVYQNFVPPNAGADDPAPAAPPLVRARSFYLRGNAYLVPDLKVAPAWWIPCDRGFAIYERLDPLKARLPEVRHRVAGVLAPRERIAFPEEDVAIFFPLAQPSLVTYGQAVDQIAKLVWQRD